MPKFQCPQNMVRVKSGTYFPIKYRVRTERRTLFRRRPLGLEGFGLALKPPISDIYCQACVLLVKCVLGLFRVLIWNHHLNIRFKIRSSEDQIYHPSIGT